MYEEPKYDVALSFAGEDREYVEAVAAWLRDHGVKVFYDNYEQVELWGKDLYTHLDYVYRKASRYCVIFVSKNYAKKVWTNHERASAQARALEENSEYVLPARFDDTEVPGLRPTVGHLSLKNLEPAKLGELIQEKLGPRRASPGFPEKIDRLLGALEIDIENDEDDELRRQVWEVAHAFYSALGRMTSAERKAVAGSFAFWLPGGLPGGFHIPPDLLRRMTKKLPAQGIEAVAAGRALWGPGAVRDPPRARARGASAALHPLRAQAQAPASAEESARRRREVPRQPAPRRESASTHGGRVPRAAPRGGRSARRPWDRSRR